jgi:hypothetical protein
MARKPNFQIQGVARSYCVNYGNAYEIEGVYRLMPVEHHYVPIDEKLAVEIAIAFEALPAVSQDFDTRRAYHKLAKEVVQQWIHAVEVAKYRFEPWEKEGQPYANSEEMMEDLRENNHLFFFTGGDPHPFMGGYSGITVNGIELTYNDVFRAVHDFYGHAAEGFQFGPRGEHNAWIHHSMMFSHPAQMALTTETRGQNSWVNYGPYKHLPPCDRPYAEQKCALLPAKYCDWRAALKRGN